MRPSCFPKCLRDNFFECGSTANSTENTPVSSTTVTLNLSHDFSLALQTRAYEEICSKIHRHENQQPHHGETIDLSFSDLLQPSKERVKEALNAGGEEATELSGLVSSHFDHSENATVQCLGLYQRVRRAKETYQPLSDFLLRLPDDLDDLTESDCNKAYDIFAQFDSLENPIQGSDCQQFQEMQLQFSQLQQQLHHRLQKSRSRLNLLTRATTTSALCLVGTVAGVIISAAIIASHAFVTLALASSSPFCFCSGCIPYLNPSKLKKKELQNISQLDAAAKGAFVLINHLATIDSLVSCLQTDIDDTKSLIHLVLKRGRDSYHIQKVLEQLQKEHSEFTSLLENLEKHICLCFIYVNDVRSMLLQQIDLQPGFVS